MASKIEPSPYGTERVSLNYGLHFTGGEPFLNFPLLLRGVEIARELNIPLTFVETNCYWCTNNEVTMEKLSVRRQRKWHSFGAKTNGHIRGLDKLSSTQ